VPVSHSGRRRRLECRGDGSNRQQSVDSGRQTCMALHLEQTRNGETPHFFWRAGSKARHFGGNVCYVGASIVRTLFTDTFSDYSHHPHNWTVTKGANY